jgi:hypothetical protein
MFYQLVRNTHVNEIDGVGGKTARTPPGRTVPARVPNE